MVRVYKPFYFTLPNFLHHVQSHSWWLRQSVAEYDASTWKGKNVFAADLQQNNLITIPVTMGPHMILCAHMLQYRQEKVNPPWIFRFMSELLWPIREGFSISFEILSIWNKTQQRQHYRNKQKKAHDNFIIYNPTSFSEFQRRFTLLVYKYIRPWEALVKTTCMGPRWLQLCYFAEGLEWRPYIFVLYRPTSFIFIVYWLVKRSLEKNQGILL